MHFMLFCLIAVVKVAIIECMGNAGPVGDMKVFYINECEPPIEDGIIVETYLESVGEEEKAFNLKLVIPYDLDDSFEFILMVDKWVNGAWQKDFYKTDGNLFEFVNKFVPKMWTKIRNKAEPQITDENIVKAGEYELKHFQAVAADIELPQILYGRFKVLFYVLKDEVELSCRLVELESISKY